MLAVIPFVVAISGAGSEATVSPPKHVEPEPPRFHATEWPEADRLFRGDPHFVGADGAYSVALPGDRVLWFFADTFVDAAGTGKRTSDRVRMVGNSLAIQHGLDPRSARFEFLLQTHAEGVPRPYFPDVESDRFWPGGSVRLDDRILVFLMRVHPVSTGLRFEITGWRTAVLSGIDGATESWHCELSEPKSDALGIHVGAGPVLADDSFVYAFSPAEPGGTKVYLARFARGKAIRGELDQHEWFAGDAGFVACDSGTAPLPVFEAAAPEFTIHFDAPSRRYLAIEATGFGAADLNTRYADALIGPWTEIEFLHAPTLKAREGTLIYQGKAHPELQVDGVDLVVTYCSNDLDFSRLVRDDAIYFPRFVKLTRE